MTMEELNAKETEIRATLEAVVNGENQEADVDALGEELKGINESRAIIEAEEAEKRIREEAEARAEAAAKENEIRQRIADGEIGKTIETIKGENKMTDLEMRGSAQYADAYKKYIITGDSAECRSMLTEIVSGDVPVPTLVENIIKHAWESNTFLSHVKKTAFRGILKVPFEKSADPAYIHTEGTTGLTEEDLQLGIVTLTPANIKKWIKVSDEAVAMGGEAFVTYIYEELAQRIMEKLVSELVAKANAASTTHSDTAIGIPKVTEAPSVTLAQNAGDQLSEEATDLCIVLNPLSISAFRDAAAGAYFGMDPFAGMTLIKCSALPAYNSANANAMYGIVGDLKAFQVNYPEGEGIVTKWDDLTYAEDDMVKIVARQYAGYGVTAPGRLVKLCKPAGGETT